MNDPQRRGTSGVVRQYDVAPDCLRYGVEQLVARYRVGPRLGLEEVQAVSLLVVAIGIQLLAQLLDRLVEGDDADSPLLSMVLADQVVGMSRQAVISAGRCFLLLLINISLSPICYIERYT